MAGKWRIKKEHLREDGCFAFGGAVDPTAVDENVPFALRNARAGVTDISKLPYDEMQARIAQGAPTAQGAPEVMPPVDVPPQMPISEQPQQPMQPSQMEQGIRNEAAAQSQIARQQAAAYDQQAQEQQRVQQESQLKLQELDSRRNALVQHMEDNPIDANRYMNTKSSLGKASTAIGLLLGGIGGGLNRTGQNVALEFLQKNIAADIEAQKANRNSEMSLLGQLDKQYGNQQDAERMLQSVLTSQLANKINQAAVASGDKLAQSRAQQAIGQLQAQSGMALQSMAKEQVAQKLYAEGKDPLDYGIQVDDKMRERAVPGHGLASSSAAATKLRDEILPAYEQSKQGIAQLRKLAGKPLSSLNPVDRSLAAQQQNLIVGAMRIALTGPGAMTESERDLARSIVANPTDLFTIGAEKKLTQLQTMLDKDVAARLKLSGIKSKLGQAEPKQATQFKTFKPSK